MPTPGVIEYPAALDTALSLIEVNNNASDTLTGNISVSDLLIPVSNPGKFSQSGFVTLVDSLTTPTKIEIVLYTSKSGSNLVVPPGGRGAQGTTPFAFSTGNFAEQRPTARHTTALGDVIRAIEAKLGIGADTPGAAVEALFSNGAGASLWRAIAQADVTGLTTALADRVIKSAVGPQVILNDVQINKGVPTFSLLDSVSGKTYLAVINGSGQLVIGESGVSNAIIIDPVTGLVTLEEIPVGPAINPTLPNQLTRKAYVDTRKISFTASFAMVIDPSTVPTNNPMFGVIIIPAGGQYTITKAKILYTSGSHTPGGSLIFQIQELGVGVRSSLGLNDSLNTVNTVYPDDFGDFNVSENAVLWLLLSSRSGTISERNVQVTLEGYRTPF
jgi:hypothetical protein